MARAVVLSACMRTTRLYKELTLLDVRDGLAILGSEVAGKHSATVFAVEIALSYPCSVLLSASSGAPVFTTNEI